MTIEFVSVRALLHNLLLQLPLFSEKDSVDMYGKLGECSLQKSKNKRGLLDGAV